MNNKYNFDNFVIGECNNLAYKKSLEVAQKLDGTCNPLILYGPVGTGKTHLMYSIDKYIKDNSNKKTLFISCDDFLSEYYVSYKDINLVEQFNKKYRDIDVLLIDDFMNLDGALDAQLEIYNIFTDLYKDNKQIVISLNSSIEDLTNIDEKIKEWLAGGLQVELLPSNYDLRIDIINQLLKQEGIESKYSDEIKDYIATNTVGDIRKIEGSIARINAYAKTSTNGEINIDIVIDALKDYC